MIVRYHKVSLSSEDSVANHVQDRKRLAEEAARASALVGNRKSVKAGAYGGAAQQRPSANAQKSKPSGGGFNVVGILSVVAVAVIVVLVALFLRAVLFGQSPEEAEVVGEDVVYQSPYDWTMLVRSDGRYSYVVDGQVKSRLGIDVSENQHEIDWNSVANDGIDFAVIRIGYRGATEGSLYVDPNYWTNFEGARSAGLDCGVYFFSQAVSTDEAVEEAEFVLEHLAGNELEYPIVFDSEKVALGTEASRTSDLKSDEMTAIAEAFCNRVEQAGYQSMVYGNSFDLSRYQYDKIKDSHIWWAEYDTPLPTARIDFLIWQYTASGEVAGISGPVDMDIDLRGALE